MSQDFKPTLPQFRGPLSSQDMRTQLLALYSSHEGPDEPQFKTTGTWWLDTNLTNHPNEFLLKMYFNGHWHEIARYDTLNDYVILSGGAGNFAIDFWEGVNPPFIANIDAYGFDDSAGFPEGEDHDVIFKMDANFRALKRGALLTLVYTMSTSEWGKSLTLRLDYRVHAYGERYDAGTPYDMTVTVPVIHLDGVLAITQPFQIPNGHLNDETVEVECRLTRMGTQVSDTHTGDLGLKHIVVTPL